MVKSKSKRKVFLEESEEVALISSAVVVAKQHPDWFSSEIARKLVPKIDEERRPSVCVAARIIREGCREQGLILRERGSGHKTSLWITQERKEPVGAAVEGVITHDTPELKPEFLKALCYALKHNSQVQQAVREVMGKSEFFV